MTIFITYCITTIIFSLLLELHEEEDKREISKALLYGPLFIPHYCIMLLLGE